MPSTYVPQQRASAPTVLQSDGDLDDAAARNAPLTATADRARYAIAVYAANLKAERPKPSAPNSQYFYGAAVGSLNGWDPLLVVCGDAEGGNALACAQLVGGAWFELAVPHNVTMYGVSFDTALGWTMVGSGGAICTAPADNAGSWTSRTGPQTLGLADCASNGAGVIVAVGSGAPGPYVLRSTDNITFAQQTTAVSGSLLRVIFAAGLWVAAGADGGGAPLIIRSADGITWSQCSVSGATGSVAGLTYTGTSFVAATSNGQILKSTDGVSWTSDGVNRLGATFFRGFTADQVSGVILAAMGGPPRSYGIGVSYDGGDTWDEFPAVPSPTITNGALQIPRIIFAARRFLAVGSDFHVAAGLAR